MCLLAYELWNIWISQDSSKGNSYSAAVIDRMIPYSGIRASLWNHVLGLSIWLCEYIRCAFVLEIASANVNIFVCWTWVGCVLWRLMDFCTHPLFNLICDIRIYIVWFNFYLCASMDSIGHLDMKRPQVCLFFPKAWQRWCLLLTLIINFISKRHVLVVLARTDSIVIKWYTI